MIILIIFNILLSFQMDMMINKKKLKGYLISIKRKHDLALGARLPIFINFGLLKTL